MKLYCYYIGIYGLGETIGCFRNPAGNGYTEIPESRTWLPTEYDQAQHSTDELEVYFMHDCFKCTTNLTISVRNTWYYYNIKMILEGIITHLKTDLEWLKPEMVVQTAIEWGSWTQ